MNDRFLLSNRSRQIRRDVRFLPSKCSLSVRFNNLLRLSRLYGQLLLEESLNFPYPLHHHPQLLMFDYNGYVNGFLATSKFRKNLFLRVRTPLLEIRQDLISRSLKLSVDHLDLLDVHPAPSYLSTTLAFQPDFH